jgi:arylsulfatase A-like enzyme
MRPLLLLALLACSTTLPGQRPPASGREPGGVPGRPTLILLLTVDQLRSDYFDRWGHQLSGGLARLYRQGAFFANGYQDHAITETAPGHSTVGSGRFPRSTGIIANALGVNTDSAPLVQGSGAGASPFRFRGTTIVDWLLAHDSSTRVLSVSRKDRGAILPVGRSRQHVYWFSNPGIFTTSRYYADSLPSWVAAFNARGLTRSNAGRVWNLLLPAAEYAEDDSVPVENGGGGRVTFPHVAPADSAVAAQVYPNYPWMDELTLEFALEGLRVLSLGGGARTDVLAISLSAMDAIGHRFGPDSREVHDAFLRLDRYLGDFLVRLYRERDSTRIVVALTADHGVNPYPEVRSRYDNNAGAGRVSAGELLAVARRALRDAKVDTTALRFVEGMFHVDRPALAAARVSPDRVAESIAAALRRVNGVLRADTRRSLARADTARESIPRRWLHMVEPSYPADVFVTLRPHWDWAGGPPIANHGSPHDYDARVPVAFFGAGVRAGQHRASARVVDIAPTLAFIAGVRPLEPTDGRVLQAVLARPRPAKEP